MGNTPTSPDYDALEPVVVAPFFWRWVDTVDDGAASCWAWLGRGPLSPRGYGSFSWRGRAYRAHRVAWIIAFGAEPASGMMICHRCDNRSCVNPEHLYAGTALDNARDTAARRLPAGQKAVHRCHAAAGAQEGRLPFASALLAGNYRAAPRLKEMLRPFLDFPSSRVNGECGLSLSRVDEFAARLGVDVADLCREPSK